jgi:uncharacterized protein (DUF1501 family)
MRRRDFLKALPIGTIATAIPFAFSGVKAKAVLNSPLLSALTNASQPTNKVLVIIFMEGGNDGLNTLIPFEDAEYDRLRKNTGFVTSAEKKSLTFKIRNDLAFNPSFNALEPLWKEGKMAVVQNIGITNADLSHFRATDIWNSASDTDLLIPTGWIGRYLDENYPEYPSTLPRDPVAISMGDLQSSLFQAHGRKMDIMVRDPRTFSVSGELFNDPLPNTAGGNELRFVKELIEVSNSYAKRFQTVFPEFAVSKVQYPDNELARNLQRIAWCVAAGMQTRIYFTYLRGFDTHASQFSKDPTVNGQGQLLQYVADSVLAFQRDLEALGIADNVLTMTYSEFGRRVFENGDWVSGTDHGTAAPHFLFGTNVNGELYGHHPDIIHLDKNGDPFIEFEFRQLYAAVLGDWFGVDEQLRTSLLSPGREHDPFDITFPVNGIPVKDSLVKNSARKGYITKEDLFELFPIVPNPFQNETKLCFRLFDRQNVLLDLFDERGIHLRTILSTSLGVGIHQVIISGKDLAAGVYYFKLQADTSARTGKIIRL